jgi:signal transduction histidine kinase
VKSAPFGLWLAASSLAAVAVLAFGLVPGGLRELRELAEENARQRLALATTEGAQRLDDARAAALTQARVLSQRPTLAGLVERGDAPAATEFLDAFRRASGVAACAVVFEGAVFASTPANWAPGGEPLEPREDARLEGSALAEHEAGYVAALALQLSRATVVVATRLPNGAAALSNDDGVVLAIDVDPRAVAAEPQRRASGDFTTTRLVARDVDLVPAVLRASLSADHVDRSLAAARRRFATTTAIAVLLAVLLATFGSQRLARPFQDLRRAAQRMGAGDLATPIDSRGSSEALSLATALDSMRVQLAQAREELLQREAESRALLSGMSEGVFAVDRERTVRALTPRAAQILRVDAAQSIGRFCGDVLHTRVPAHLRPCEHACPIVDARGRGASHAIERIERNGAVVSVLLTCSPPAGDRQVLVVRDETDLEAARRARDAFLANVTHELRTPLSAQLASIELLQTAAEATDAPPPKDLLDSLQRSTLRLAQLVDDLLESVRIEAGRSSHRRELVQLTEILAEVEETMRPLARQAGVVISLVVGGDARSDTPEVVGDTVQLRQVFVNLVANAIRHSPVDGRITLAVAADDEAVEVSVSDDGPGIPAELGAHVFERFQRAETGGGGLGLGLWIARSIVERHAGTIRVVAGRTRGACVAVRLPRGDER